jgi:hypothetical protein
LAGGLADAKRVSTAFSVSGLFPKLTEWPNSASNNFKIATGIWFSSGGHWV